MTESTEDTVAGTHARDASQRALDIEISALGEDHPKVAMCRGGVDAGVEHTKKWLTEHTN